MFQDIDVRWVGNGTRAVEVATIRPRHELRVTLDGDDVLVDSLRGTKVDCAAPTGLFRVYFSGLRARFRILFKYST